MKHSDWHEKPQRKRGTTVKRLVRRSFAAVAALVVFATTYAMILPAVTASVPTCGIEEHTHTEACYRTEKRLICDNTDENHAHTEECYAEQQVLVCGLEAHTHTDECYEAPTTEPEAPKEKALSAAAGSQPPGNAVEEYTDFEKYLTAQGGSIVSYLKKGGSIVSIPEASGDGYTYQIKISSPSILSGTYYYPLPKGMTVDVQSKSGEVSNGGTVIGTYEIITDDSSSYILFTFGKDAEQYQTISGRIEMAVSFAEAMEPAVSKDGWLVSPEGAFDGFFHFKITAQIPAAREGAAKREWKLLDTSLVSESLSESWIYDFSDHVNNANMNMSITYLNAESGEEVTYPVKNLSEVSEDLSQTIAYYADSESGYLYLVNRCQCEDSALCPEEKDGECDCELLSEYPGWCTCWSLTENAAVAIEYKNAVDGYDGTYILSDQKTLAKNGGEYENRVTLTGTYKDSDGQKVPTTKRATAVVNYKDMLEKQETARGEGDEDYIKTFRITVNKPFAGEHADERADFSLYDGDGDGKPDGQVVLTDSMTNLKYIPGSMKITAENGDESIALVAGTDFTVEATQTDNGTDLKITLLKLGKYEYQIEYSAQVFADSSQKTVTIGNKAQIGTEGAPSYQLKKQIIFEDEWNFDRFETTVCKVDYDNQALKIEGAVFALFAGDGTKMAEQTTGKDGNALFQTNSKTGLIYRTDTLYYIQETQAPEGYGINTAKYWFYFSKQQNTALEKDFAARYPGSTLTYVSLNEESRYAAKLTVTDERLYELPETGGSGTAWFYLTGGVLTALSAIVIVITFKRRYNH